MKTEKFVKAFFEVKEDLLKSYTNLTTKTEVGLLIKSLNLSESDSITMNKIINSTLTDAFYNILLGLDGSSSIGGLQ